MYSFIKHLSVGVFYSFASLCLKQIFGNLLSFMRENFLFLFTLLFRKFGKQPPNTYICLLYLKTIQNGQQYWKYQRDVNKDRENEYNGNDYRQSIQSIQFTGREEPGWSKRTALTLKDFFLGLSGLALRCSFPQTSFGLCSGRWPRYFRKGLHPQAI